MRLFFCFRQPATFAGFSTLKPVRSFSFASRNSFPKKSPPFSGRRYRPKKHLKLPEQLRLERENVRVIQDLGRKRDWQSVLRLMLITEHVSSQSFCAALEALSANRRWREALALLDEMKRRGLQPNSFCYSAVISACVSSGQPLHSLKLLKEMRQRNLRINLVCFDSVIRTFNKAGLHAQAMALLREML